jgi:hypothetical protein
MIKNQWTAIHSKKEAGSGIGGGPKVSSFKKSIHYQIRRYNVICAGPACGKEMLKLGML